MTLVPVCQRFVFFQSRFPSINIWVLNVDLTAQISLMLQEEHFSLNVNIAVIPFSFDFMEHVLGSSLSGSCDVDYTGSCYSGWGPTQTYGNTSHSGQDEEMWLFLTAAAPDKLHCMWPTNARQRFLLLFPYFKHINTLFFSTCIPAEIEFMLVQVVSVNQGLIYNSLSLAITAGYKGKRDETIKVDRKFLAF